MDGPSDAAAVRISDSDRWAVDARLQQAVGEGRLTLVEYEERCAEVWRARTRAELDATTHDLPVEAAPVPAPAPAARGARPRARRVLGLMSGDRLTGPVAPGQAVEGYALMGGAVLDLRRDDLPPHVAVRAVAVMGGVEVLVPKGVTVHLSGMSLMGGRDVKVDPPRPGAPVVEVQGYALMGGVQVWHGGSRGEVSGHVGGSAPVETAPVALTAAPVPVTAGSVPVPAARSGRTRHQRGRSFAVIALAVVVGSGIAASRTDGLAVFGSSTVRVGPTDSRVQVGALFGSVEVVVPDDARVRLDGVVVFGSSESDVGPGAGPTIDVDARGAFGSVKVLTQEQAAAEEAADRADDSSD